MFEHKLCHQDFFLHKGIWHIARLLHRTGARGIRKKRTYKAED